MEDHLVAVTSGTAIEACTQRALGQKAERIRAPLGRRHLVGDSVAPRAVHGLLEQAIGQPLIEGGTYVEGCMSRKKQVVPPLERAFATLPGSRHAP